MAAIIDILVLILLIIANGFFSMAEFALVSSRKMQLRQLASENRSGPVQHYRSLRIRPHFYLQFRLG